MVAVASNSLVQNEPHLLPATSEFHNFASLKSVLQAFRRHVLPNDDIVELAVSLPRVNRETRRYIHTSKNKSRSLSAYLCIHSMTHESEERASRHAPCPAAISMISLTTTQTCVIECLTTRNILKALDLMRPPAPGVGASRTHSHLSPTTRDGLSTQQSTLPPRLVVLSFLACFQIQISASRKAHRSTSLFRRMNIGDSAAEAELLHVEARCFNFRQLGHDDDVKYRTERRAIEMYCTVIMPSCILAYLVSGCYPPRRQVTPRFAVRCGLCGDLLLLSVPLLLLLCARDSRSLYTALKHAKPNGA